MSSYFDTSYLVVLYVPNDHTVSALRHRERTGREVTVFTPLHRLELRTTVRQCVHSGLLALADGRRILRHIEEDLDDGTLRHTPFEWTQSLRRAKRWPTGWLGRSPAARWTFGTWRPRWSSAPQFS